MNDISLGYVLDGRHYGTGIGIGKLPEAFAVREHVEDGECVETLYVPERTCHYFPDEWQSAFDENDEEIETGETFADGCDYSCDICGFTMLGGEDGGWFDETPGEYGGWNYKPRFNFCPNCGAKVEMGES